MRVVFIFAFILTIIIPSAAGASQDLLRLRSAGDLYVAWAEFDGNDNEIYISRRTAGRWSEKERLTDNDTVDFSPCVAVDKNARPWVVWAGSDGLSTAIYSRRWNGESWSKISQVDSVDLYEDTQPSITVDEENIPWVVWCGTDGRDDDIYISSWNGRHWAPERMVNADDNWPDLTPAITSIPGRKELFIAWMGYNGSGYELYYTSYGKGEVSREKSFSFKEFRALGKFPSFLKYTAGKVQLFWIESGGYSSALGDGINWEGREDVELAYTDEFLVGLLGRFGAPIWIAWVRDGLRQNFRLVPVYTQKILAERKYLNETVLGRIVGFFDSRVYAESEVAKYIAFGDSITYGAGAEDSGYPSRLETKLNQGIGSSVVINEGVGGEDTPAGVERIESVLRRHKAQYLLLQEGTNDITGGFSMSSIKFNLGLMIDSCIGYETTPLLSLLTARKDSLDRRTRECNEGFITPLAEEKEVLLVDNYTPIAEDKEKYLADGKHPTDAGYEVMAATWYNAIKEMLGDDDDDDDDGGCGAVILPAGRGGGRGVNFGLLFIVFILALWFRMRLCRG